MISMRFILNTRLELKVEFFIDAINIMKYTFFVFPFIMKVKLKLCSNKSVHI